MANQIQQLDGQAVTNFEIVLPQQPTLPLTSGIVTYLGSDLIEDVFGRKEYRHKFSTLIPEFVNDILRTTMASGTPAFRFRLGLGNPQQTQWLPWQEHVIVHYGAIVEGISKQAGHTLEITTSDALFKIGRANKTVAHKGSISSIVATIAQQNQLQAVIEETSGQYLFVQNFIDDVQFIRERLVRRAVNLKGRGNFLFYILDNVLHFHSPDYQTSVKEVQYYQQPGSDLVQVDRSQQGWDEGIAGTRVVVYDPLTGETREVVSDPSRSLRYAKGIYQLDSVVGGQRNIFYHLGANRPDEAKVIGQNTYEHARLNTFELNVDFDKNISIRTGDIINLVVTQQSQKTSPWSGLYLVAGTVYTIANNAVVMKLILRRGEIQPDLSNVVTQVANRQLVPQAQAQGQDINLAEAQSSILTKGAGDQQSDSNFSKIQNPNTPLG
jgi:hypothetical protein